MTKPNISLRRPTPQNPAQNLHSFVNKRNRIAKQPRKPKTTPEDYQALKKQLNDSGPIARRDAEATKGNIDGMKRKWIRFCQFMNEQDWRKALQNCNKGTTMAFLHHICENGQVRVFNSAHQYLLQFKQLYNRVNGQHMDTNDAKDALQYLNTTLADEFQLDRTSKAKPVLGADDILLLLTHHWARNTSTFPIEDQRLALATIMLMSIYTGCRPAELVDASKVRGNPDLDASGFQGISKDSDEERGHTKSEDLDDPDYSQEDPWSNPKNVEYSDDIIQRDRLIRRYKALCYEDIRLWVVRNSKEGERDLLAMEITFAHHKGVDRKPKPTTFLFHEETLPILCPVSHILAIAIRDDAFEVEGFTRAEPFFETNLQFPTKAVLMHWKPELLKTPIFRQAVRAPDGFTLSTHKALRYSTYAYYLDRLGWAAGFEQKLTSYCFRRGTGNAVDGAATVVGGGDRCKKRIFL